MHARKASGVLLVLGFADLATLDLVLAPRFAHQRVEPTAGDAAVGRALPTAVTAQSRIPVAAETLVPRASVDVSTAKPLPVDTAAAPARSERALPDIQFELGDDALESYFVRRDLIRIAAELRDDPTRRLVIRGHSDRLGTSRHNLALSRRRAATTARYLVARGAPVDRIEIEAVGDGAPADLSDTPVGWARNRRVEVLWK